MRKLAVTLAVLVVGAGLVAALPASAVAFADPASEERERPDRVVEERDPPSVEEREPPDLPEQWRRTYGASGDDVFADLVRTRDGGYLLVGWTQRESIEAWVVKTDAQGEREWAKTLGGAGTDRFWGVVRTENGYLAVGRNGDGGSKGWVVELGSDGDVLREQTVGSGAFYAVARKGSAGAGATDGGNGSTGATYVLAGWTPGDGAAGWAVALDRNLSTEWERSFSAPEGYSDGYLRAVVPTDSGYYLAGKIEGDSDDGWALKVDSGGDLAWQTTAGGPSRDDVWAAVAAVADAGAAGSASGNGTDAGFVLVGETESGSDGPRDGWLVKFGPDGAVEWEARPGGAGTQWLDSAMRTGDGYLFTGGTTTGPVGSADGWVLRTNADGNATWERYYGTPKWDKAWPAIRAHGGGLVLAGRTAGDGAAGKDGWILKVGNATIPGGTTVPGGTAAPGETTAASGSTTTGEDSGDGTADGSTDRSTGTTDEAIRGDTATATAGPEGGVPGFGLGAIAVALLALAALLAVRG